MKKLRLILPAIALIAACNSIPASESGELNSHAKSLCEDDTWLEATLESLKGNADQKLEIIRYRYKDETVYLVDNCVGCADAMQVVYSCTGEERCKFGGIAGFNTCPDFFEKATDKTIIWQN